MVFYPQNELYHYGIKGMKWGVRRTPEQLGHHAGVKKKKSGITEKLQKSSQKFDKKGMLTEEGHRSEVERRRKMSIKEQNAELRKLNDGWYDDSETYGPNYRAAVRTAIEINTCIGSFPDLDYEFYMHPNGMPKTRDNKRVKQSSNVREIVRKYHEARRTTPLNQQTDTFREKWNNQLDSAYLKELGYSDTPFARKCIRPLWDQDSISYNPVSRQKSTK